MFSKTYGYALRAVTYVAIHGKDGAKIGLLELSKELDIPHHFLGKIMQDMVRQGIVDSLKGPTGGFFSNDSTAEIPLVDILKITDGNQVFDSCALGIRRCNAANPCPLHHEFAKCRNGMLSELSVKKVKDLAEDVVAGNSFLAR
jgi:Rrf2 family protein